MTKPEQQRRARLAGILSALEDMATGDLDRRAPISPAHDEIDAVAYAINVLVGELHFTVDRLARTEREAHQANEQKSLFLRNVSHELRTPLAAILSYLDLLKTTRLDQIQREAIERIAANGDALLHLIEDFLDRARIEAGQLQFALKLVSPAQVTADVVESLTPQARAKGVQLTMCLPPTQPGPIVTDPRRLRQILMNVVGNAVKFTDRGEVVVSLQVEEESRRLIIEVADSGIGMSASDQRSLFSNAAGTDRDRGGAGLGLILSRHLSRQLGGDLELVSSHPGDGSRFRVVLGTSQDGSQPTLPAAEKPSRDLDGLSVLLVEDNPDLLACYSMLLEFLGCSVAKITNGLDAIEQALIHHFDVVLMDIQMPVLDGLEATRRLRQRGYDRPIFALSAHAMSEDRQQSLEAGCNEHIAKPVDMDHLVLLLATHRAP